MGGGGFGGVGGGGSITVGGGVTIHLGDGLTRRKGDGPVLFIEDGRGREIHFFLRRGVGEFACGRG